MKTEVKDLDGIFERAINIKMLLCGYDTIIVSNYLLGNCQTTHIAWFGKLIEKLTRKELLNIFRDIYRIYKKRIAILDLHDADFSQLEKLFPELELYGKMYYTNPTSSKMVHCLINIEKLCEIKE